MYAYARDVAECTWVEEAVWYIDALPVFPKIVVGFGEKVDGFRSLPEGYLFFFVLFRSLTYRLTILRPPLRKWTASA